RRRWPRNQSLNREDRDAIWASAWMTANRSSRTSMRAAGTTYQRDDDTYGTYSQAPASGPAPLPGGHEAPQSGRFTMIFERACRQGPGLATFCIRNCEPL